MENGLFLSNFHKVKFLANLTKTHNTQQRSHKKQTPSMQATRFVVFCRSTLWKCGGAKVYLIPMI